MIVALSQFDINQYPMLFLDRDYIQNTMWHYEKNRRTKTIYYLPVQGNEKRKDIITGADYDSFTPIDLQWAKDKNHYYIDGKKTEIVTKKNPRLVGVGMYIVDEDNVYDWAGYLLPGIDKQSFQLFGNISMYAKDKNHIYIGTNIFTGVDYDSFRWLNRNYGKDKNHVYFWKTILTWVDNLSFESLIQPVLDDKKENILYDAKDANHYYKNWTVVVL